MMAFSIVRQSFFLCTIMFCIWYKATSLFRNTRMVNGRQKIEMDYQSTVYLNFHRPNSTWAVCSGSIIGKKWIVTLAYCIRDVVESPELVSVGVGTTSRLQIPGSHNFTVSAIVPHPNFILPNDPNKKGSSMDYNLALLKLSKEIPLKIDPIALASASDDISEMPNPRCKSAGWGTTTPFSDIMDLFMNNYLVSKVLREIDVRMITKPKCITRNKIKASTFYGIDKPLARILCGMTNGDPPQSVCTGDEGSPLICESRGKYSLQGMVIGGDVKCRPGMSVTYFTEMSKYRAWIDGVLDSEQ